jgi:hypothetical protein
MWIVFLLALLGAFFLIGRVAHEADAQARDGEAHG